MTDRLALVTGGGRRIGAQIALRLADAGYRLAIHTHSGNAVDPALQAILDAQGGVSTFAADLGDPVQVEGLWAAVCDSFGFAPDLLINSAAAFGQDTAATATAAALTANHAVNALAPVLLAQALARTASAARPGAVVNILDQRIAQPNGDQFSYTLSKLALAEATKLLARTLAPHVRVNGVAPGLTLATADYSDAQLERLAAAMPLALLPDPEDIADAVVWLATRRAVTGQILFVDGGAHMRAFERDFMFMER